MSSRPPLAYLKCAGCRHPKIGAKPCGRRGTHEPAQRLGGHGPFHAHRVSMHIVTTPSARGHDPLALGKAGETEHVRPKGPSPACQTPPKARGLPPRTHVRDDSSGACGASPAGGSVETSRSALPAPETSGTPLTRGRPLASSAA